MNDTSSTSQTPRPPIVAIMGHIDHGKSTLLDYIRKTNVVASEAGGITQHLSAYKATHTNAAGDAKSITFLDTPGHAAFQKMRSRGAEVADIVILVVSAEEGVKPQTMEAVHCIKESGRPFIVAINKIDKPEANVDRTQASLLENGIFLEGIGGDIPWVAISAKLGTGVSELLDMVLLVAELEELGGNPAQPASGIVIEGNLDPKKGISATLIIKNGTLRTGTVIVSETSLAPVRLVEDFNGKKVTEAGLSDPIRVIGFTAPPRAGAPFTSVANRKEAESLISALSSQSKTGASDAANASPDAAVVPIVIKTDVLGTIDAIEHEIAKLAGERVHLKIVHKGVGSITENDVKLASGDNAIILGFNVRPDARALQLAERSGIVIETFDIIYKLAEWLEGAIVARTPKMEVEEVRGRAKVLKVFSINKDKQVIGCRLLEGSIAVNETANIIRHEAVIGKGRIVNLQQQKADTKRIEGEGEFGAQIQSKIEVAPGDLLECIELVTK